MYGHESKPSLVYSYGAKLHKEDEAKAVKILRAANIYRNNLVELEHARRARVDQALTKLSPKLAKVEKQLAKIEEQRDEMIRAAKTERVSRQSKVVSEETASAIRELTQQRERLWGERKALRDPLFKDKRWKPLNKEIEDDHKEAVRAARKVATSELGLYFGTYLDIEMARRNDRKDEPPMFKRFDGNGQVCVQVQNGGHIRDAVDGGRGTIAKQFQISDDTCRLSGPKFNLARIRIGSDEKRQPIWLDFRVHLHRPIPDDASVKWARLVAKRVGTRIKWQFHLVLARDEWERKRCGVGSVAIMPGWAVQEDGIRVATWAGDDGGYGQLILPNEQINRIRKAEDLRSIRDKNFDDIRERLEKMLTKAPEWLKERTQHMCAWRSQARLAMVVLDWRDNRWKGDSHAFAAAEAWRKQDKHLLEWEANQRDNIQKFRKNLYRNFAAEMASRYQTVVLPDIKWGVFMRQEAVEDNKGRKFIPEAEQYRRLASPYALAQTVSNGMDVVKVSPTHILRTCGYCGNDREGTYHQKCECGVHVDESRVLNLLRRHLSEEELAAFFRGRNMTDILRMAARTGNQLDKTDDHVETQPAGKKKGKKKKPATKKKAAAKRKAVKKKTTKKNKGGKGKAA